MTVRIVTDSACDLPSALAEERGIVVVPLTVRFGEEEYRDRVDIDAETFWAKLAAGGPLPETAAPSVGAFSAAFDRLAAEGASGVVCITLSSRLSATHQAAQAAAGGFKGCAVAVIDSLAITASEGNLCLAAARLAANGAGQDAVVAAVVALLARSRLYGVLDSLEHLRRGGRIGGAQALLGSRLSIKPVLELKDGVLEPAAKVRTRKRATAWLVERLGREPIEDLALTHGNVPDLDDFVAMLEDAGLGQPAWTAPVGAVIGAHAGPGVIIVGCHTAEADRS